jgi:hypothetical protein
MADTIRGDKQLMPGRILLRCGYVGPCTGTSGFNVLRDADSGLEIRCKEDFTGVGFDIKGVRLGVDFYSAGNPIPKIFGLSKENPDIFYPVIIAPEGDFAYLLEPPKAANVFPGGAVTCFSLSPANREEWMDMCLVRVDSFYNGSMVMNLSGNHLLANKYEMMMHHPRNIHTLDRDRPCFALVYGIQRHFHSGVPQNFKHINAVLLGFYDAGIYQDNLTDLEFLRDREPSGEFWFDHIGELPADFFENLIRRINKIKTSIAINTHSPATNTLSPVANTSRIVSHVHSIAPNLYDIGSRRERESQKAEARKRAVEPDLAEEDHIFVYDPSLNVGERFYAKAS